MAKYKRKKVIATEDGDTSLRQWQEQLINHRLSIYDANPQNIVTLAQFKTRANALIRELKTKPQNRSLRF